MDGDLNLNRAFALQPIGGFVSLTALAPDGKLVATGPFVSLNGHTSPKVVRFYQNGTVDRTFISPATAVNGDDIRAVAVQFDGRILLGGLFGDFGGQQAQFLVRLTAEGLVDPTFKFHPQEGDSIVSQILPLPDGGMIVAGGNVLNGVPSNFCRRLAPNGSVDSTLQLGVTGFITSMLLMPDGKILLGGANFLVAPNTSRFRAVRINVDGSWDSTWNYGLTGSSGGAGVSTMALQADGSVLIALPGFSSGPAPLERALTDGTVDAGFHPGNVGNGLAVADLAIQPDGKILAAVNSTSGGPGVLVRLLSDGSLDAGFSSGNPVDGGFRRIGLLPDGTAMVFGAFTKWGAANVSVPGIARIAAYDSPAKIFSMSRTAGADELWEGAHQEFSVIAGGTPDPTYQWTLNGAPLPNATGEKFTLNSVTPEQAGIYDVTVSNAGRTDIGAGFLLKVKSGPPEFIADLFDDLSVRVGGTASLGGFAVGGPLPEFQWFKDGVPMEGQTGPTLTLSNFPPGIDSSSFTLQAKNSHGTIMGPPLHFFLTDYGSIRPEFALERRITETFNPPPTSCQLSPPGPWPTVYGTDAIAAQSDGKIIVGGLFGANTWVKAHLQRLLADGSQDTAFQLTGGADASGLNGEVDAIAVGADQMIWVGGRFNKINGLTRIGLARLNPDGSLDLNFNPALSYNGQPQGFVTAMVRQPDGKIIAGGLFEKVNDVSHPFLVRFNADGSVDESFHPLLQFSVNTWVLSLALQPDGKVLVGGGGNLVFYAPGRLIRLQADGTVEQSFSTTLTLSPFGGVTGIAVDSQGRILAVGPFFSFSSDPRAAIVRLLGNGNSDPTFSPVKMPSGESFTSIALQPNGRIIVGGSFGALGQNPTHSVGRLNSDGSVDQSFLVDTHVGSVSALTLLNDGLLVGGTFSILERAAGKIGTCNASAQDAGLVKLSVGNISQSDDPPQIVIHPHDITFLGGDVTLSVTASGAEPLSYTWLRNDSVIAGAPNAPSFTIQNAKPSDTAQYRVRVTNKFGADFSDPAVVNVVSSLSSTEKPTLDASGFKFNLALANNGRYEDADLQHVHLQASGDLEVWENVTAAIRVVNGEAELVDPSAVLQPQRFYRFLWGDQPTPEPDAVADDSSLTDVTSLPAIVRHAAELHLQEFIQPPQGGYNPVVGGQEWVGVGFAPQARYLYDPAYHDGNDPAYVEFKMIHTRSGTPRGYMLVSMNEEDFPILEYSTSGQTKTEKVLHNARSGTVHKFFRMTPGFITGEDSAGNMVSYFGTCPAKLDLDAYEGSRLLLTFDSDSDTAILPRFVHPPLTPFASYNEMKNDLRTNPARQRLRSLRVSEAGTHWVPVRGERYPSLQINLGETNVIFPTQVYTSARVDADDTPNVSAAVLRSGGVRVVGLRMGSDIVRLRTSAGSLLAYTVNVVPQGGLMTVQNDCEEDVNEDWWAGTGWAGDQRQYEQTTDYALWCPYVGCGPTALAMLFGWWDVNGVPSAFYRLRNRVDGLAAIYFNFDYVSVRLSDASKYIHGNDNIENAVLFHDVYTDLHDLCNTMCFSFTDQGATYPDQLVSAFLEYERRCSKPLPPPMNEFGDQFISCSMQASYVTPGVGQTDWEGGGTYVANGIKAGHPGIVGIGNTIGECHYPLAYVYRRHSHYVGCGSSRHRDSLSRAFKLNMGWGPGADPEWHNAENVWFGLTTELHQLKLPVATIKHSIYVPGVFP